MRELALFAGAGGGILGGKLLGWRTVGAVEIDEYARQVLIARQNDGCLEPFPIWDDVRTFDGRPWRGVADVVSAGFPCQDISVAGTGDGLDGKKSGLWREVRRIVGEVGPDFVWVENSPALTFRGGLRVLGDLATLGYDARWGVVGARHTGAPHERERMWILAYAVGQRGAQRMAGPQRRKEGEAGELNHGIAARNGPQDWSPLAWWSSEPRVGRMVHGVANRMDRLRCGGNGQVPEVVRRAWSILSRGESPSRQHQNLGMESAPGVIPGEFHQPPNSSLEHALPNYRVSDPINLQT